MGTKIDLAVLAVAAVLAALCPSCSQDQGNDRDHDAGDSGSDTDTDTDSDSDSDSDADAGADAGDDGGVPDDDCAPDDAVALATGETVDGVSTTAGMGDSVDPSCDLTPNTGAADFLIALSVAADGDLVLNDVAPTPHVFALYLAPVASPECPAPEDEIGCYFPYAAGGMRFSGLPAGEYLLAIRDYYAPAYGSGPASWILTLYPPGGEICNDGVDDDGDALVDCADPDCAGYVFCQPEQCANGVDDDLDGATDCLDFACSNDAACNGSPCAADVDLGPLVPLVEVPVAFDTTIDGADAFDLPCTETPGGVEYVVALSIDVESRIRLDIDQAAIGDHDFGVFVEGGPDDGCAAWPLTCYTNVVQHVDGALMNHGDPVPPGEYFTIFEVAGSPGPVALAFAAVPVCGPGEWWDPDLYACAPWACAYTDLGTWSGAPFETTVDTCDGPAIFGDEDVSCTGLEAAGNEAIFGLVVPAGDTIGVTADPAYGTPLDPTIYLLTECLDFDRSSCLAGVDEHVGGLPETLAWTNDTGADLLVYLFADSSTLCGEVTLTIE